ncbi:hypothetical protein ACFWN5_05590 [Streptomyces sp. NPDC058430]|uniref:hypothetical protein n=1 Tax=Streptomyces sp. NPDC058430 TaxID=3346495 RepID=UPI00365FCC45
MAASDQIAVPAQHRVRSHQQPQSAQHVEGQTVQQRSQERPVARSEPRSVVAELTFQHSDLMAQGEDLRIFVPFAHRQQSNEREGVGHGEVGQAQQRDRS